MKTSLFVPFSFAALLMIQKQLTPMFLNISSRLVISLRLVVSSYGKGLVVYLLETIINLLPIVLFFALQLGDNKMFAVVSYLWKFCLFI